MRLSSFLYYKVILLKPFIQSWSFGSLLIIVVSIDRSRLDLTLNGNNQTARQETVNDLQRNIDNQTDFSFPIIGHKLQDSYKGGLGYAPFVESSGVAFVVYTDTSSIKEAMFNALLACWPVILIPMIMAYIAGVFVWILVSFPSYSLAPVPLSES